jgi:hypothetical protein
VAKATLTYCPERATGETSGELELGVGVNVLVDVQTFPNCRGDRGVTGEVAAELSESLLGATAAGVGGDSG